MTTVLALDLSLSATGIAWPDGNLATYRPTSKGDWRLVDVANQIDIQLRDTTPQLVVIEDLPHGLRNAAAGALGMLHGAVRVVLLRRLGYFLTIPPATLKTYATGRGNAPKPDLRMELYKRTGVDVADDNQVDAAWLRLLALDLMGYSELELPKTHRRALDKLTLPSAATLLREATNPLEATA